MSNRGCGLRTQTLAFAVAGVFGLAGTAVAAVPAAGQFATVARATRLHQGDVVSSALPINNSIHVTIALKLRNEAQLRAFLAAPAHGVMARNRLFNEHLPTAWQAQSVVEFLTHAGFRNVTVSPDRMLVSGDASVAIAQATFRTNLVGVRTHDGRNAFANSSAVQLPVALQGSVQSVLGLQTVHMAHTLVQAHDVVGVNGHKPSDFAAIYDASGMAPATGVNVGIWGWGSMTQTLTDLATFASLNSLTPVTTQVVCTDYGQQAGVTNATDPTCGSTDMGSLEWDLDSQDIVAMSGGVHSLTFYAASSAPTNAAMTDTLSEIVNPTIGEARPAVINASFGECERAMDSSQGGDGSMQADDALLEVAASQGVTFSVSTGDSGADECGDSQFDSASYPASSPWVVAVSGSTLRASSTTWARETAWTSSGGSPSSAEQAQPWQSGLTYGQYAGMRGPDVTFDASPDSGAIIVYKGGYAQVGGTSLAAPLFAGSWARILEGNQTLGFAAPHLYALPASVLHDVTAGNNGGYIAKRGWDWATGLGSFNVSAAAAALQQ